MLMWLGRHDLSLLYLILFSDVILYLKRNLMYGATDTEGCGSHGRSFSIMKNVSGCSLAGFMLQASYQNKWLLKGTEL